MAQHEDTRGTSYTPDPANTSMERGATTTEARSGSAGRFGLIIAGVALLIVILALVFWPRDTGVVDGTAPAVESDAGATDPAALATEDIETVTGIETTDVDDPAASAATDEGQCDGWRMARPVARLAKSWTSGRVPS